MSIPNYEYYNAPLDDGYADDVAKTYVKAEDPGVLAYRYPYHNQYDELARAFASGQLSLLEKPPDLLAAMDNPYDTAERDRMLSERGEGYRWDTAYYEGSYYVYFGVVPVCVFYLPYYLLSGSDLPNGVVVEICAAAFLCGLAYALSQLLRRYFPAASCGLYLVLFLSSALASCIAYAAWYPGLYTVPIMMAMALCVWAVGCLGARRPKLWLASLLIALIFGCRPQIGLVGIAILAFATVGRLRKSSRRLPVLLSALIPLLAMGILIGAYNAARFGSPFDFGANYNLTTNDMSLRSSSVQLVLYSLYKYYLEPFSLATSFPFFVYAESHFFYEGKIIQEAMFGGLCFIAPFTVFASAGLSLRKPCARRFTVAMICASVIIAIFDSVGAGVLCRYQLDIALPLVFAAIIATIFRYKAASRDLRKLIMLMLEVFIVVMAAFSVAMVFTPIFGAIPRGYNYLIRSFSII